MTNTSKVLVRQTFILVSTDPEARYSPNGWKSRLQMLALCPIRVRKTGHTEKQTTDNKCCNDQTTYTRRRDEEAGVHAGELG